VPKPVRLRERATADVTEAIDYYQQHAGGSTALECIDAVQRGVTRIGRNPQIGSLRVAYELMLPGVRAWPVSDFPYVLFYLDTPDHVDVWRVLHERRDIPSTLLTELPE